MDKASSDSPRAAMASRAERLAQAFNLIARDLSNPWDEGTDRFLPFHALLADDVPLDAQGGVFWDGVVRHSYRHGHSLDW